MIFHGTLPGGRECVRKYDLCRLPKPDLAIGLLIRQNYCNSYFIRLISAKPSFISEELWGIVHNVKILHFHFLLLKSLTKDVCRYRRVPHGKINWVQKKLPQIQRLKISLPDGPAPSAGAKCQTDSLVCSL